MTDPATPARLNLNHLTRMANASRDSAAELTIREQLQLAIMQSKTTNAAASDSLHRYVAPLLQDVD